VLDEDKQKCLAYFCVAKNFALKLAGQSRFMNLMQVAAFVQSIGTPYVVRLARRQTVRHNSELF